MILTFGIPVLNRGDLLERCLESVDHPFQNLVIINNGQDASVEKTLQKLRNRQLGSVALFEKLSIERCPQNLGVAPSWNRIIKKYPGSWLITGSDVQFKPGAISAMAEAEEKNRDASLVCGDGYSVFAMTEVGRKKVGLFDENFYPAYFEDVDHWRRVVLSGAKAVSAPGFEFIHGEGSGGGSCSINSDSDFRQRMARRFPELRLYYERKWGGPPSKETFLTPFNSKSDLASWTIEPALRKSF